MFTFASLDETIIKMLEWQDEDSQALKPCGRPHRTARCHAVTTLALPPLDAVALVVPHGRMRAEASI